MSDAFLLLSILFIGGLLIIAVLVAVALQRRSLADDSPLSNSRLLLGECHRCGYNLNRNTSGVCPECGTPVIDNADLRVPGRMTCCLCGKLLGSEDREDNGLLTLPTVALPSREPLSKFIGAQVHRSCYALWPHRRRFEQLMEKASERDRWK